MKPKLRAPLSIGLLIALFCAFALAGSARAMDVTLTWEHSPSPNVAGYLLYYKTGSSGPPYDGTGALEGPSPIDVGYVTSCIIHDLQEDQTYIFALTAYDFSEQQSCYSNEASTGESVPGLPAVLHLLLDL